MTAPAVIFVAKENRQCARLLKMHTSEKDN